MYLAHALSSPNSLKKKIAAVVLSLMDMHHCCKSQEEKNGNSGTLPFTHRFSIIFLLHSYSHLCSKRYLLRFLLNIMVF